MECKRITVATLVTMSRFVMVPFIVVAMLKQAWMVACLLLVAASLTDLLDGALARWLKEETELGAYLDPLADKVLLVSTYSTLLCVETSFFYIPPWFFVLIILREIIILGGALLLGLLYNQGMIRPTLLGKTTTALQLILMIILCISLALQVRLELVFDILFAAVCGCIIASLVQYVCIGLQGIASCRIKNM